MDEKGTTIVGINTPEGIVMASDMLKIRQRIEDCKLIDNDIERGFRKIYVSGDKRCMIGYVGVLNIRYETELPKIFYEEFNSGYGRNIAARIKKRLERIVEEDERRISEVGAIIARLKKNKHFLEHIDAEKEAVETIKKYKAIGAGEDYAAPVLRECKTIKDAIDVAERAILAACEHKNSDSAGLNVYTLDKDRGVREVKRIF